MASIEELLWDEQNIAHIARHRVTPLEVEEVVFDSESVFLDAGQPDRPGRLVVLGQTPARRYLAVYLDTPSNGRSYPVTARSMTAKERRLYRDIREEL